MKTVLTSLVVCLGLAATIAAQAGQSTPPNPQTNPPANPATQQPAPEVTLTGCLIQGSAPTIYVFDNAKKDPKSTTEKGLRYLVIATAEDLDLRKNLNHEVQMVGRIELKPAPPAGQKVEEKDLPRFTTKSLTSLADTCGAAR